MDNSRPNKSQFIRFLIPALAVCLVLGIVLLLVLPKAPAVPVEEPTYAPGESNIPEGIASIFPAGDGFYYTTQQGQLFLLTDDGSTLKKEFPAKDLFWSEPFEAFLYYHEGAILSWKPETDATYVLAAELPQGTNGCFLAQVKQDFFFRVEDTVYRYRLSTRELFTEDSAFSHMLACSDRYYLYKKDNAIVCFDLQTGQQTQIAALNPQQTITSACIQGDALFYLCDAQLRSAALTDGADDGTGRFGPVWQQKYLLAIACSKDSLVFLSQYASLAEDGSYGPVLVKAELCTQDGLILTLREPGQPEYRVPGSCVLAATDDQYCYGIKTDPTVILGDLPE